MADAVEAAMAAIDAAAEQWAVRAGWRHELDQLSDLSRKFAGAKLRGPGGAELEMLILRQRGLIDRWIRQAFAEGVLAAPVGPLTRDAIEQAFSEPVAFRPVGWPAGEPDAVREPTAAEAKARLLSLVGDPAR